MSGVAVHCCPLTRPMLQFGQFQLVVKQKDAYLRAAQFAARFIAFALRNSRTRKAAQKKAVSMLHAVAGARKCFGLLNSVTEAVTFRSILYNGEPMTWPKAVNLVKFACMFHFWLMDNTIFLSKWGGALKIEPAWWGVNSCKFWFGAVLCSIAVDTKLLLDLSADDKSENHKKTQEVRVRMCRNVCDFFVAGASANAFRLHEGALSLLGTLSALIMCYELWPAPPPPAH
eukprot:TRINITY_DN1652_c0_g1_i4.p1 TRINITY_DN1652_c0_g1~~TRINITY_DN1652_c0_g1_i4.p1  ORF type:complete len:260 (-),score=126.25 TRINITY_DN1652_c0_g1_i4:32-718(-)